ncbi:UNVERIFIED_CONTAM: hypothetical protein RMT77_001126 [Armadillidium vulgare]
MNAGGQGTKKNSQTNSPSKLLSNEENETLFKIMGARCQAQVSAVVQVFGTEPPNHSSWKKLHCGAATFTKDNTRRSYFIQVYDIVKEQKLLEQEIYNLFSYHVSLPFFHQFEGENQMIGLNFADNQEAEAFSKVITDRLEAKLRKKEERKRQQQLEMNAHQPQAQNQHRPQNTGQVSSVQPTHNTNRNRVRKGRRTHKIRKDQISEPTNFQHITHVGFDQDKGITSFNANDELNEFFKLAGVSQKLLQDDNTRKFIYDFIDQHGGVERATQESKVYGSIKRGPPPTASAEKEAHKPSAASPQQQKPALPSRNSTGGAPPPPPPPRPHVNNHPQAAPPPPPPPKEKSYPEREVATHGQPASNHSAPPPPPPPPRIPSSNGGAVGAPPPKIPVANGVGPVPPPPPPPPVGISTPPVTVLPTPQSNSMQIPHPKSDLLAQIRQRPALNPVSQHKIEKPEKDSRTTLLSEIRNREYELKPVIIHEGDASPVAPPVENSMAAMLAKALEGRAKVIQDESDSEDEDDEDEDEWDDN